MVTPIRSAREIRRATPTCGLRALAEARASRRPWSGAPPPVARR